MKSVWLHERKSPDVKQYLEENDIIILPVGSTEQHGAHLPIGTDSLAAIYLAEEAAKKAQVLVAPPCWYGWAPHHMSYPGTITLSAQTLITVLEDIATSLVFHGFKKIVLLNGHRGANNPPLDILASRVRNRTGALVVVADPFFIAQEQTEEMLGGEEGIIGHAGGVETAHMLYLRPELVDLDGIQHNREVQQGYFSPNPYSRRNRVTAPSSIDSFRAKSEPLGHTGDPTWATKERGEKYHEFVVAELVQLIDSLRAISVTTKSVIPPV
ncbi:MAG: creatininase family protein [Clostridiales bacterium]|mgnify:CR=1 FL=1|jgi:creatinine amidohydrolase|nr:creatininase family protein [Bacillota bacterium]NLL35860.1 creatininase family protein [Clostridiales bacterium]